MEKNSENMNIEGDFELIEASKKVLVFQELAKKLNLDDYVDQIEMMLRVHRPEDFKEETIRFDDMIIQMESAYSWAKRRSYAVRRKVGAVLYKNGRQISLGFNGTKKGYPNVCEKDGQTIQGVIHAEKNAYVKLLKDGTDSPKNSALFVTTGNCINCAEEVILAESSSVYFTEMYRSISGLEELIKNGISVYHLNMKMIHDYDKETENSGVYDYRGFPKEFCTPIYVSEGHNNVKEKLYAIARLRKLFENYNDGDYHNKFYDAAQ